ncbi:MAG: ABC transporter ATP-binding protein [Stackebrandtia sp.]
MTTLTDDSAMAEGMRAEDLRLSYHGTTVVHSGAISLAAGTVTALVGPNGSGKSTLLRCLARLHRPDSGAVHFTDGTSAAALSAKEFAKRVTLLAQSRPTPSGIRVCDVVGYGRHPYCSRWKNTDTDGARTIAWAMDVTGTAAMAQRPVDELSGGERQRVWLATCLAQDTGILLLDEPTTYLDLRFQVEILDLARDLADDHNVAVGVVLHDLNQAAAIADRVVLLRDGAVMADGIPAEVLTSTHLSEAYGIEVMVGTDGNTGLLTTCPVGKHTTRSRVPA